METKKIWESKTFWINVIAFVMVLLSSLEQLLSSGVAITIMAVVNIVMRAITKSPVTFK